MCSASALAARQCRTSHSALAGGEISVDELPTSGAYRSGSCSRLAEPVETAAYDSSTLLSRSTQERTALLGRKNGSWQRDPCDCPCRELARAAARRGRCKAALQSAHTKGSRPRSRENIGLCESWLSGCPRAGHNKTNAVGHVPGGRAPLEPARSLIVDPSNEPFLSAASAWEIAVKHDLGRLDLRVPPDEYVWQQRQFHRIESLSIDEATALQAAKLPNVHRIRLIGS